jgi:pimeloyl-ACP methyl ester carboxylesterase
MPSPAPTVILLHGLWMSGFELGVLKRRLQPRFNAIAFSYPSISGSMAAHAGSLIELARAQRTDELHFIGHSLGGLVILRALQLTDDLPPGRAVLLGTPLQGSKAAQAVARWLPFAKAILGPVAHEEIVPAASREWSGRRDVGVIAGSMGMGLGRLFADFDADNDGTVAVAETQLPGARDHIVMSTSHTGLLFSSDVADQAAHFLKEGMFRRDA